MPPSCCRILARFAAVVVLASPWLPAGAAQAQGAGGVSDVLVLGYAEGFPGDRNVAVRVLGRHDSRPIHGFSLAIEYPPSVLRFLGFSKAGSSLEPLGPEFFVQRVDHERGQAVLGSIFSYESPIEEPRELVATESDGPAQILAWLYFDVRDDAVPGDYTVRLGDNLLTPPVSNRFTYEGETIIPRLVHGTFSVRSQYVLSVGSRFAFPGARVETFARVQHPEPISGYQVALTFDRRALELERADVAGTEAAALLGGPARMDFIEIDVDGEFSDSESRSRVAVVFDYPEVREPPSVLPPVNDPLSRRSIVKYQFRVTDIADSLGDSIDLSLGEVQGALEFNNAFLLGPRSVRPRTQDGRIYFSTGQLTGRVLDESSGLPLASATVALEPLERRTRTDSAGRYEFSGLPPGSYTVRARSLGHFPNRLESVEVSGQGAQAEARDLLLLAVPSGTDGLRRGFINGDRVADIADSIAMLEYLFLGRGGVTCEKAADINDDGIFDVTDAIVLLGYLFLGGDPPAPPFATCDVDPTEDALTCALSSICQ